VAHTLRRKHRYILLCICSTYNITLSSTPPPILYYCSDYFYMRFFLSFSPSIAFWYAHMYTMILYMYTRTTLYIDVCESPTPRRRQTVQKEKKKKKKALRSVYVTRAFQHARPPRTTTVRCIILYWYLLYWSPLHALQL